MPLPTPISRRALTHTRNIRIEAFERDDGLWDLDVQITDIKTHDMQLASGLRAAGDPIHDLKLRITIDDRFTIVDAQAVSDSVPYPGYCNTIGPAYETLVGLNLLKSFRLRVAERLAGIKGCAHLTELCQMLPTAAIQALSDKSTVLITGAQADQLGQKPFEIDGCHALRSDGKAVAKYYPRWAVKPENKQSS